MAKRNSDGDVLTNRLSIGLAKHQSLLASWMGPAESTPNSNTAALTSQDEKEDDDLNANVFGHDRLGVGGILPKDIADGSFTRRLPTSNDKLLEQLIGKKRAKAHIAAKLEAARPNAKPQKFGKPDPVKKEESEDEEEGRSSAFKSRRSGPKKKSVQVKEERDEEVEDEEELQAKGRIAEGNDGEAQEESIASAEVVKKEDDSEDEAAGARPRNVKRDTSRQKAKPKSFLDEILAERSKKKQNKSK
ncbi:hypothetical protein P153DRAFT_274312, partial [Dothidotthia symphoricarpi CBS 119687]